MFLKHARRKDTTPVNSPSLRRRWSLAMRLTVWYTGSAFILVLIATGFLYWSLVGNLDQEDDRFLRANIEVLQERLHNRAEDTTALKQLVELEFAFRQYAEIYIRILDDQGHAIVETPGMADDLPPAIFPSPVTGERESWKGTDIRSRHGKPFRAIVVRTPSEFSSWKAEMIQVAFGNASEEGLLTRYRRRLWRVFSVTLIVCALIGYRIARRGIRPIREISEAAQRVRLTTLHERIETTGLPAELFALAQTFNHMLNRLEESFARLSQFSADIAHELRTPVNNLRGEAEVALQKGRSSEEYRETLESCLEECVRLSGTIDRLLFLARADDPETHIDREPIDVGQELAAVREFYEVAATEAGVTLTVQAEPGVITTLDRTLFQRAVGNLISNALAHTPRGGTITMTAIREDDHIHVDVADTGCGIAPEHLPHIFDRFYRVDRARSAARGGVGLGLAIVKSIATLHGGSADIVSKVGQGTRVSLLFPAFSAHPTRPV